MSSFVRFMDSLVQVVSSVMCRGVKAQFIDTLIGRHCCLWCTITYGEMKVPLQQRGSFPPRSVEGLRQDHQRFIQEGKGNIRKAKLFNNSIGEPLIDIPLEKVKT